MSWPIPASLIFLEIIMPDSLFEAPAVETASPGVPAEAAPAWAAVLSLAFGVFGLVTAEFLPASLLTPIAADLGVTDGSAGQAVTATAIIGAIAALTGASSCGR